MAEKVTVTVTCDMPGDNDDAREVAFTWDGHAQAVDLCKSHEDELAGLLRYLAGFARRAAPPPPRRSTAARRRGAAIRTWAQDGGHAVRDRGRIPGDVVAAYDAAH